MLNESPNASSMRNHLNCSQVRVEQAISAAQGSAQNWSDHPQDVALWKTCLESIDELKVCLDDHVARVAGEGVLEDAVTRHPSLYPTMRDVETWQERLADRLRQIRDEARRWNGLPEEARRIAKLLLDFRAEFILEEREERHLMDRGLR